jgi:tRNA A-37 threonylcarbamoyl transferase component Bud32
MPQHQPLAAPIAYGRTAEVYDWDGAHVLKLYYTWCPPHWVEQEARVVRVIAAAGIPTPAAGDIVEVDDRRGIIYERVNGVSMLDDMKRRPWLLLRHARALAGLQAQFNRLTIPNLHGYRDGLVYSIQHAPHLPEAQRAQALEVLETLPDGQALCHGDFHPGNVLISARGPVVIDWMTASLGSPWADVARSSMLLTVGVKAAGDMVNPVIRLLSGQFHRTYLNRYRSLVPDGQAELTRWLPVIAAARLDEQIELERAALLLMVSEGLEAAISSKPRAVDQLPEERVRP